MARASLADLQAKPRNDAYTVLLSISLVAMIAACLLLWYNLKDYGKDLTPPRDFNVSGRKAGPAGGGGFDSSVPPPPADTTPPAGGTPTLPPPPAGGNP
jgi:hypothetical protein